MRTESRIWCLVLLVAAASLGSRSALGQEHAIPSEFKDPDTGLRIVHLSRAPNPASGVIYFTQPCVTPDSRYAIVRYLDPDAGHTAGYLYRYDLQEMKLQKLADRVTKNQWMAPASGNIYYSSDDQAIYLTNILSMTTKKIADMPPESVCTGGLTVNADETLVLGVAELKKGQQDGNRPAKTPPNQGPQFGQTFERHDTNILFTAERQTGQVKEVHRTHTWLGHTQFSPTDPTLVMFCHEGPWAKVDRIWTMRLGQEPTLLFKRTEAAEIAGHEFWCPDGRVVWFDHNIRDSSGRHWLTGKKLETGEFINYRLVPEQDSIHYTQSPDLKFFVADGGTRKNPATQAMSILIPQGDRLKTIKLCNMAKNDYKAAEPNPHLTPDQRWVLFTATFSGAPQAYAIEMPKEYWRATGLSPK